jgi:hypothetical protein
MERDRAVEQLLGFGPPGVLVGSRAVAPCCLGVLDLASMMQSAAAVQPPVDPRYPTAPGIRSRSQILNRSCKASGSRVLPSITWMNMAASSCPAQHNQRPPSTTTGQGPLLLVTTDARSSTWPAARGVRDREPSPAPMAAATGSPGSVRPRSFAQRAVSDWRPIDHRPAASTPFTSSARRRRVRQDPQGAGGREAQRVQGFRNSRTPSADLRRLRAHRGDPAARDLAGDQRSANRVVASCGFAPVGRGTGAGARLAVAGQGHRVGVPGPSTGADTVPTRLTPPTVVRHCCEEILGRMRANLDELVAVLPHPVLAPACATRCGAARSPDRRARTWLERTDPNGGSTLVTARRPTRPPADSYLAAASARSEARAILLVDHADAVAWCVADCHPGANADAVAWSRFTGLTPSRV